jgi:FkbM family methyltransferase
MVPQPAKQLSNQGLWFGHFWLTGHRIATLKIRSGPAKGIRMRFDLRQEGSYWLGHYDAWVLQRLKLHRWLRPGQVAWDGGAYIGYYTAIFRGLVGSTGRVVAFEASSANYERVASLPHLNGWSNVEVVNQAIGPDHCAIEFVGNLGGSSGPYGLGKQFAATQALDIETVPCAGVDELVYEHGMTAPDFIKFDLETAETYALHNGDNVFTVKRPLLLLELHGDPTSVSAGRFLETYDYAAWDVLDLPKGIPPMRGLREMKRPPDSHMMFCVPAERIDEHTPA